MSRKSYKTPPSLHPHPNLPSHDGNVVSRRNLSSPPLRVPTPSNSKLASKLPPVHRTPFKHSSTAELMDYSWIRSMRRLTTLPHARYILRSQSSMLTELRTKPEQFPKLRTLHAGTTVIQNVHLSPFQTWEGKP